MAGEAPAEAPPAAPQPEGTGKGVQRLGSQAKRQVDAVQEQCHAEEQPERQRKQHGAAGRAVGLCRRPKLHIKGKGFRARNREDAGGLKLWANATPKRHMFNFAASSPVVAGAGGRKRR